MTRQENLKYLGYRFLATVFAKLASIFEYCAKKFGAAELEMTSRAAVI